MSEQDRRDEANRAERAASASVGRRQFLKGLGVAAVVGASGTATADQLSKMNGL